MKFRKSNVSIWLSLYSQIKHQINLKMSNFFGKLDLKHLSRIIVLLIINIYLNVLFFYSIVLALQNSHTKNYTSFVKFLRNHSFKIKINYTRRFSQLCILIILEGTNLFSYLTFLLLCKLSNHISYSDGKYGVLLTFLETFRSSRVLISVVISFS